jgi:hypothetical protein
MAPEIVSQRAKPNRLTDYFSLSVLLFYIFHIQHPLVGKKILTIRSFDRPAREKLFGAEPVFIFDPSDRSNEAISDPRQDPIGEAGRTAIPYWRDVYPTPLKQAFTKCFTCGIADPRSRMSGVDWINVLATVRNMIFRCEQCGREMFLDLPASHRKCWHCGQQAAPRFMLEVRDKQIPLSLGKTIRLADLVDSSHDGDRKSFAEVVAHPTNPSVWGMKNSTAVPWVSHASSPAAPVQVPPGKSVPLFAGTTVTAGNYRLKILENT